MNIIHIADVHLGAEPDAGCAWSKERASDIYHSFQKMIARCGDEKVDLLLIAGDLFHHVPLLREIREVDYLFQSIPDTKIVLTAGNHDYLRKGNYCEGYSWSSNVIGLWNSKCERVEIPELHTAVYGCSYHSREIKENPYRDVHPFGEQKYHILLAHGGDYKHAPFTKQELSAAGFDYVALGHIHKPQILVENHIAYAGALEPIDCNDMGAHGYMQIRMEGERVRAKFQALANCEYRLLELIVNEDTTQLSLEQEIRNHMQEQGGNHIYHLHLTGERAPGMEFDFSVLRKLGRFVRVKDMTHPAYHLEELLETYDGTLIGTFIRRLQGSEGTEQKALYYGLEALLEAKR